MNHKYRFFIILVLAAVASSQNTTRNQLEEGFLKLIEKWRKGDVGSLPIALPTLPLKLAPNEYEFDRYKLSVAEAEIRGVEDMVVKNLTAWNSSLTMFLNFEIPDVMVLSDQYHLQAINIINEIENEEGEFRLVIKKLKVYINLEFGAQGSNTVIKKLDLDFTVGALRVMLMNCSVRVFHTFGRTVWTMVQDKNKYLMDELKNRIIKAANIYLRGLSPDQLMQIISSI